MRGSRRFGASRIDGLDVARAVAVFGMVAAHVGNSGHRGTPDGWGWLWIADGRSSAMFAVLAGVSMSLMATRAVRRAGEGGRRDALRHTRVRIAVRGVLLIVVGLVLKTLDTPVAIILATLGVMFLLATLVLGWRARWLAVAAVVPLGAGWFVLTADPVASLPAVPVVDVLWGRYYPAIAWMGYVLAGMAVGRLALTASRVQAPLAGAGVVLASAAYTLGPTFGGSGVDPARGPRDVAWASVEAHSYTPFEMFGNLGVAMAVIGLCVFATQRARAVLWPLIAVGSMAFTMYVAQILVIWRVGEEMVWSPTNEGLITLLASLTGFACLWRWLAGQGPLERIMTSASSRAADAAVGRISAAPRHPAALEQ